MTRRCRADVGERAAPTAGKPARAGADHEAASAPCGLDEAQAAWSGFADAAEIRALLTELLAAERAGARGVTEVCLPDCPPAHRQALRALARDEGRCCTMLARQLRRYVGRNDIAAGAFFARLRAEPHHRARLALLDRGQAWVVRRLDAALPRIRDTGLLADLRWMRDLHVDNLAYARQLVETAGQPGDGDGATG